MDSYGLYMDSYDPYMDLYDPYMDWYDLYMDLYDMYDSHDLYTNSYDLFRQARLTFGKRLVSGSLHRDEKKGKHSKERAVNLGGLLPHKVLLLT